MKNHFIRKITISAHLTNFKFFFFFVFVRGYFSLKNDLFSLHLAPFQNICEKCLQWKKALLVPENENFQIGIGILFAGIWW